ncbi:LysR family transcriptional regulator [Pannonibacter phragmitetus]|jgi:DNA-binding transcriptional LysR family regulator|uniref:LysR family transcriptional regulator n=1 Tax=Pannonibacter phragmitetus TaxID=121719 RepID=A0A0U3NFW0_9HYPH|nr:LysR family transcriptional regulator [Pannonibacter phragmitetus]ALV28560.1 LysR family transcriptional regulator [Pannonibacter phragmitetus]
MAALLQTLAVAEYLSFRHAANALGVSQSSVSARVKALEEDLGILLFERHARGVRLTDAGRYFVDRVAAGVDQLDYAVRTAGMVARGEQGSLRLGIHALIPGSFLANLLERYRQQHPGIEVEIAEGTARDTLMQLRANRLDVTFVAGSPEFPDCHSRPIWNERLLAVLPSSHPLADRVGVTWADLADETFIVRHGGTGPQAYDHIVLRLAGGCPNLAIMRFDVERGTLLSMVAQSYGVTVVGEATSLIQAPGVTFLPILDEPEPFAFSAVWSPHNRSLLLRNLLGLAAEMGRSQRAA